MEAILKNNLVEAFAETVKYQIIDNHLQTWYRPLIFSSYVWRNGNIAFPILTGYTALKLWCSVWSPTAQLCAVVGFIGTWNLECYTASHIHTFMADSLMYENRSFNINCNSVHLSYRNTFRRLSSFDLHASDQRQCFIRASNVFVAWTHLHFACLHQALN